MSIQIRSHYHHYFTEIHLVFFKKMKGLWSICHRQLNMIIRLKVQGLLLNEYMYNEKWFFKQCQLQKHKNIHKSLGWTVQNTRQNDNILGQYEQSFFLYMLQIVKYITEKRGYSK